VAALRTPNDLLRGGPLAPHRIVVAVSGHPLACLLAAASLFAAAGAGAKPAPARDDHTRADFPALYTDARPFLRSIHTATRPRLGLARITGLTVPHHLLAADLIAEGFHAAARMRPDRIVILLPDHFGAARRPAATTTRGFRTVLGPVAVDRVAAQDLLRSGLVEDSELFRVEHALGALLPYVRHFFPGIPIVPVALALGSRREEWDELTTLLTPLVGDATLVIQSTDFSHYLPHGLAAQRDQEVLHVLAAGDATAVAHLVQPDHTDSKGAQYVQMRLQERRFHARPIVLANRSSAEYGAGTSKTTSYVVQVYARELADRIVIADDAARDRTFCFAGDTFFGRFVAKYLARPDVAERVAKRLRALLDGCKLIVNLEGVVVPSVPDVPATVLAMPSRPTVEWLRRLGVVAVGIANNHARDLGDAAYAEMVRSLEAAGIRVLRHGRVEDLGPFRVLALTDLENAPVLRTNVIGGKEIESIVASASRPPLFAFLHWGTEYEARPGARERALLAEFHRAGVQAVVGAHPHRASRRLVALAGGEMVAVHSLGNFLFDQRGTKVSGAVLQVTFYPQGTFFSRLVPLPALYALGRR
jgi:poly-gamma-glutamate synthesis protein (capsule biosynthesis protein)